MSEDNGFAKDIQEQINEAKLNLSQVIKIFEENPEKLKDEKLVEKIHELESKVLELMFFLKSAEKKSSKQ